jgi:hypothetical protein
MAKSGLPDFGNLKAQVGQARLIREGMLSRSCAKPAGETPRRRTDDGRFGRMADLACRRRVVLASGQIKKQWSPSKWRRCRKCSTRSNKCPPTGRSRWPSLPVPLRRALGRERAARVGQIRKAYEAAVPPPAAFLHWLLVHPQRVDLAEGRAQSRALFTPAKLPGLIVSNDYSTTIWTRMARQSG